MDQITDERGICLMTMEVYRRLEKILNKKWFPELPRSVRKYVYAGPSTSLTRVFSSWWIIWNRFDPSAYPLPGSLRRCGDPSDDMFLEADFIDCYGWETDYGVAIRSAWHLISEVDRDLMLFSWAARQDYRCGRNFFAHPKPTLEVAFDIIERDLEDTPQLQYRALSLIYQSQDRFA